MTEILIAAVAFLFLCSAVSFKIIFGLLKTVKKLSADLAECCEELGCGQFAY